MNSTTEFYKGGLLPFITQKGDNPMGEIDFFTFGGMGYEKGCDAGMQAAYRLMLANERGVLTSRNGEEDQQLDELFRAVIEAACAKARGDDNSLDNGIRGAAVGLLSSFSKLLAAMAKQGTWRICLAEETAMLKEIAQDDARMACRVFDAFAESMLLPIDAPAAPKARAASSRSKSKAARAVAVVAA